MNEHQRSPEVGHADLFPLHQVWDTVVRHHRDGGDVLPGALCLSARAGALLIHVTPRDGTEVVEDASRERRMGG